MILALVIVVAAVVLACWEALRLASSACQWFSALWASSRPAGGWPAALPASKPGGAVLGHEVATRPGPRRSPSSNHRLLSSPYPARCTPDLESGGRLLERRLTTPGPLLVVPLGAIDPTPNFHAFGAGVELGFFIALFTAFSLGALNWFLKTIRSSSL